MTICWVSGEIQRSQDEIVKKNIGLSFDFIRAAVTDPHLLDKVPDGAEIEFLEGIGGHDAASCPPIPQRGEGGSKWQTRL